MLNIIIVSDDLDVKIGSNCVLSHQYLTGLVNLQGNNVIVLDGDLSTAEEVEKAIVSFNGAKFILIAFSHGCADALLSSVSAAGYVTIGNSYFFSSSFVYTNSCYTGITLKACLIDEGCLGYVGYSDVVKLPENEADEILFIACENSGLVHFLTTNDSLADSVQVMKTTYQQQYDALVGKNMNIVASWLLHNLNCLTYHENGSLTRKVLEN